MSKVFGQSGGPRFEVRAGHLYYAGPAGAQHAIEAGHEADFHHAEAARETDDGPQEEAFGEHVWRAPIIRLASSKPDNTKRKAAPRSKAAKAK